MKAEAIPATVSYAALSHCWGLPSMLPIRTLKENIACHRERILFVDLSRTFQDAIQVARGLHLSYLWIDCLCIVQDDKHDWERESVQMAQVYRESVCTISALSSDGGDGGCRVNAREEPVEPLRYVDLDIGRVPYTTGRDGGQRVSENLDIGCRVWE